VTAVATDTKLFEELTNKWTFIPGTMTSTTFYCGLLFAFRQSRYKSWSLLHFSILCANWRAFGRCFGQIGTSGPSRNGRPSTYVDIYVGFSAAALLHQMPPSAPTSLRLPVCRCPVHE